jgi:polar amino acid transport system substrate-binding protein
MRRESEAGRHASIVRSLICCVALLAVLAIAACGSGEGEEQTSATDLPQTISATIQAAFSPICSSSGGGAEPTGIAVDLLNDIASEHDQQVEYTAQDFAGSVASIESQRADVLVCIIFWDEKFTETGIITDPFIYQPPVVAQPADGPTISTIEDLADKTIGTLAGYLYIPGLQSLPGTDVRTYTEEPSLYQDVAAGRLDVAVTDGLVTETALAARPEWNLKAVTLETPTPEQVAENPELEDLRAHQGAYFVSKDQPALAKELSQGIRQRVADGTVADIIQDYDITHPDLYLTPPGKYIAKQRQGVDRPADWQPPQLEQSGSP